MYTHDLDIHPVGALGPESPELSSEAESELLSEAESELLLAVGSETSSEAESEPSSEAESELSSEAGSSSFYTLSSEILRKCIYNRHSPYSLFFLQLPWPDTIP